MHPLRILLAATQRRDARRPRPSAAPRPRGRPRGSTAQRRPRHVRQAWQRDGPLVAVSTGLAGHRGHLVLCRSRGLDAAPAARRRLRPHLEPSGRATATRAVEAARFRGREGRIATDGARLRPAPRARVRTGAHADGHVRPHDQPPVRHGQGHPAQGGARTRAQRNVRRRRRRAVGHGLVWRAAARAVAAGAGAAAPPRARAVLAAAPVCRLLGGKTQQPVPAGRPAGQGGCVRRRGGADARADGRARVPVALARL